MNRKERKRRIREKQLRTENGEQNRDRQGAPGGQKAETEWETVRCARAMNRAREFEALCKKEGRKSRWPMVLKNANPKISPQMMKWRRISSITLRLEPFMDDQERRAGLARLMGWLEKTFIERHRALKIENCKSQISNLEQRTAEYAEDTEDGGDVCATGSLPSAARADSLRGPGSQTESGGLHGQRQTAAAARGTRKQSRMGRMGSMGRMNGR